jgi:methylated-DNA-[protein]-cysteine S-methyltransferase
VSTYARLDSPVGQLTIIAEGRFVTGLYVHDRVPIGIGDPSEDPSHFEELVCQLERYFGGEAVTFDVALRPRGTAFQQRVWEALRQVPYGHTITYGELARRIGHPTAVRAVGRANGANPISILVPCHRVIGGNGSLTGYSGGLERKRKLLALEGCLPGGHKSELGPRVLV